MHVSADLAYSRGDQLLLIYCFVAVAEHLSFNQAVKMTGFTPSTISRKVARLEEILQTRLFERTTRKVALTEAGRLYLDRCTDAFKQLNEANAMLESLSSVPRGLLRLSFPVEFGRLYMTSATMDFVSGHPELRIDISYTDSFVDLIEEGIDLAVRIGNMADSGLMSRKIADNPRLLVATPAYLEKHGTPASPADLHDHHCLSYTRYADGGDVWELARGNEKVKVRHQARIMSDNSGAVYEATLYDHGISVVAAYLCIDAINSGRLVRILPEWRVVPESSIYLVFANRTHIPPKVRAFIDFVAKRFIRSPWNF